MSGKKELLPSGREQKAGGEGAPENHSDYTTWRAEMNVLPLPDEVVRMITAAQREQT